MQIQRQEAQKIIDELGVMPVLRSVGEARIVGSVALDVIVKRDIDVHLVVNDLFSAIDEIYAIYLSTKMYMK